MNRLSPTLKRRRYHLHWRVRKAKLKIKLLPKTKIIELKHGQEIPDNKWLQELLNKHGYQVQMVIE